jgi:ABC-2 type transport system ATP-binding protein
VVIQAGNPIQIRNITKSYGSLTAIDNISISFSSNSIYGLFGRNGAGKTTLLNIMTSRIFPDQGEVFCHGKNISSNSQLISKNICYMPEKHYFIPWFKVKKILALAKGSFPNFKESYADKLCRDFGLKINQHYSRLSRGYQSVVRIIIGFAANAPVTLFDEPVAGLDAVSRDMFYYELVKNFSDNPRLFIIATHFIEESSDLFNEAIIIKNGKLIKKAPVEDLLGNTLYVSGKPVPVDNFIKNKTVLKEETSGNFKTALVEGKIEDEKKYPGLRFSKLTMQKLFIQLTGGKEIQENKNE